MALISGATPTLSSGIRRSVGDPLLRLRLREPGKFSPCEKSYMSVSVAALKLNLGDAGTNFKLAAGYTPINSGTVKSSWGLNPHAFRGFDSALTLDKLS